MDFIEIDSLKKHRLLPGVKACFFHTDTITVAHWIFEEGAELPRHSHPHEQVSQVIEGTFTLTIGDDKSKHIKRGSAAIIEPNTPHFGKAITKCYIIDVFHPVREDYRKLED